MTAHSPQDDLFSGRLLALIAQSAQRGSQLHRQFLQTRQRSLGDIRALIAAQMGSASTQMGSASTQMEAASPESDDSQQGAAYALFDSVQLDEFGTGRISRCFGEYFAKYDTRRIPRIPNGDLKMMSRVTAISGARGDFSVPAAVTVEYDVPRDAWYMQEGAAPDIPVSLWMEIALQPCGFLSAYLDTYAQVPYGEFQFRNLDGSARLVEALDVRGRTITTRARLLTSVVSSGTVIQKYSFVLTCAGRTLYEGESTFGYFSIETMANQVGLDGGRKLPPALRQDAALARSALRIASNDLRIPAAGQPNLRLGQGKLAFLDEISFVADGGRYGKGYLYAARPINPADWFYPCHFYQDPVMPGSLGVEAILEAMQAYALTAKLGAEFQSPRFAAPVNAVPMTWRYRGQIIQQNRLMEVEIHLSGSERQPGRLTLLGDASLWVDDLRIYEIKNAAVSIVES